METGVFRVGNNYDLMLAMPADCVDMIYMDPPFYSGRDFGDFDDGRWGSIQGYVAWMEKRARQCKRLLKPTGTFWMHVDTNAVHYLKVMLDRVFGISNFKNDIAVQRKDSGGMARHFRKFPCYCDRILFYGAGSGHTFNEVRRPLSKEAAGNYKYDDGDGNGPYAKHHLGTPTRGRETKIKSYTFMGIPAPKGGWQRCEERMRRDYEAGNLVIDREKGRINYKSHLKDNIGVHEGDLWTEFCNRSPLENDYETQKPARLLKRIVKAGSDPGGVVLDPFAGSGTTLVAAERLGRRWIGMDASQKAKEVFTARLGRLKGPA